MFISNEMQENLKKKLKEIKMYYNQSYKDMSIKFDMDYGEFYRWLNSNNSRLPDETLQEMIKAVGEDYLTP